MNSPTGFKDFSIGEIRPKREPADVTDLLPSGCSISSSTCISGAVGAGASMINDVNALRSAGALDMAAKLKTDICLMHMQGSPRTMQNNPTYEDVVKDVKVFFKERIEACKLAGIDLSLITLDPGFGFGKKLGHNIALLKNLSEFHEFGVSILAGLSRKSMIGTLLGDKDVDSRMVGRYS